MNKKVKVIFIISIILLLIVGLVIWINVNLSNKSNEKYGYWITDNEFLYDKAIKYLKEEKYKIANDKDKEDYQIFCDYEGFGIKEKDNKKYGYMYILEESYYVKHEKLRSSEKSCMPYKFIFENNEVIGYETPQDGSEYITSIKDMFPNDIEHKVLNYNFNIIKLSKEVEKHYSYLESTLIIDVDSNEDIIAICGIYSDNISKHESNMIKGNCIDGYGDIYEYNMPCNENEELLVDINDIDKNIIAKYQGDYIASISKEDLNEIKSNLSNLKEDYSNINTTNKETLSSFVKVLNTNHYNGDIIIDSNDGDFIDLIIHTSNFRQENISETSKNILNILAKYNLISI